MANAWRSQVQRLMAEKARAVPIRPEWKRFGPDHVEVLRELADPERAALPAAVADCALFVERFGRTELGAFAAECLVACLDGKRVTRKFAAVFAVLDEAVEKRFAVAEAVWPVVFGVLVLRAVDGDAEAVLAEVLQLAFDSHADEEKPRLSGQHLAANAPALMNACGKNSYALVKLLVNRGYRLKTARVSMQKRTPSAGVEESLRDLQRYAELPFLTRAAGAFDGADDVVDLHILRMMATPAYILACYVTVAERREWPGPDAVVCDCVRRVACFQKGNRGNMATRISSSNSAKPDGDEETDDDKMKVRNIGLRERMEYEVREESFHYCPANEKFLAHPDCSSHLECNDPILRCFDLAKMASDRALAVPEYRREYADVADSCRKLSVQLLDLCEDSAEVQQLLAEDAGASRYFRYVKLLSFPRLNMAVEHNHKEFVGHMYSQQMLRRQWYGSVPWPGRTLTYRLAYFFLHAILTPVYVSCSFVAQVGRDIITRRGGHVPQVEQASNNYERHFYRYLNWCNDVVLHMDIPINRFIAHLGYYLVYLSFIMVTVLKPSSEGFQHTRDDFKWYHAVLTIYAISFLWKDLQMVIVLRTLRTFFKFWRAFDLIMHVCLAAACVMRIEMEFTFPECEYDEYNDVMMCRDEDIVARMYTDSVSSSLLATAATLSVLKLLYWMQMHDRVGPVVINISKVVVDILTMVGILALMLLGFGFGFTFILHSSTYVSLNDTMPRANSLPENNSSTADLWVIIQILFWKILDPGPEESLINGSGIKGVLAGIMFGSFQVLSAVVFLNVLVATMNATIQKVKDREDLYWKFSRTSVWMGYFDALAIWPPPFGVVGVVLVLVSLLLLPLVLGLNYLHGRTKRRTNFNITRRCHYEPGDYARRREHAALMIKLVERYLRQCSNSKEAIAITKDDLKQMKQEIVEEVVRLLKSNSAPSR